MGEPDAALHLTRRGHIARILGATLEGLEGRRVRVEVDVAPGLPGFSLVGLPSAALRESRERIAAALRHADFAWPEGRVTVNLAPADLRKDGASFDLPIAVGILVASGQIHRPSSARLRQSLFVGEVALDGALRPTRGLFALALDAEALGVDRVVCPPDPATESGWAPVARVTLRHLRDLQDLGRRLEAPRPATPVRFPPAERRAPSEIFRPVAGQWRAKRALLLAALGGHHLYLQGPPGCGKTLLARCLAELLPPLEAPELCSQLRIRSCSGLPPLENPGAAPFRAPHHSVSVAGLVGGGRPAKPGEVTLAHGGVLFLDELPEFGAVRLEALREVLETGTIRHARLGHSSVFPARFQLVGAGNPCPCGWYASSLDRCRCPPAQVRRYQGRLSGPLRDRIDLWVDLDRESATGLWEASGLQVDDEAFRRGLRAGRGATELDMEAPARRLLATHADRRGWSLRAVHSLVRVASTIARLAGGACVQTPHVAEALEYRVDA